MEASVAYLLVGGAPFCDAIGLAQPDVEVAQADYTARLAGLMQQVLRALGVETGEDFAWVQRLHAGWRLAHEDRRGVVLVYQLPLRLAWVGERGAQHVHPAGPVFEALQQQNLHPVFVEQRLRVAVVVRDLHVILEHAFIERAPWWRFLCFRRTRTVISCPPATKRIGSRWRRHSRRRNEDTRL